MSSDLTVEQQKRIEENRRKALALRQKKLQTSPSTIKTANIGCSKISNVGTNILSGPFHDSNKSKTQSNAVRQNSVAVSNVNKSNYQADYKPSQSTVLSVTSSTSGCSNSVNFNKPSLSNDNSLTKTSGSSNIDFDRIEQNRLKALSRRAEKLCKSPERSVKQSENMGGIPVSTTNSSWQYTASNSSSITSFKPEQSSISNVNFDKSVPAKNQSMSMNTTKQPSFTGQNIFSGFPGTPVKGGCYLISKDRFTVKAGYSEPLIQLFKAMDTKLYDAVTKKWSFKLLEYNKFMSSVVNLRPSVTIEPLPPAILKIFSTHIKGGNSSKTVPMADLSKVEPSLVNSLMSFQREGVNFGIQQNGRVLIADDMGLGKTIQAICLAYYYRNDWPLLVVVPSSVRFDWAQNFQRWVPSLDPQCINTVVSGKDSCTTGLINILSYDLMARKANNLKDKRFQVVIMDECHFLKNYKTARCKAALPLLQNAKRVILLSGTPALSRPLELFTQINAVCPYLFKFHDFGMRYCDGKQMPWGPDYSGSSNMEELQILLEQSIMIRRLKTDVLTELPEKIRQMIMLDPSLIQISRELKTACKVMNSGNLKKMEQHGALLDFFHKSGSAKMKAIKSYVDDILESDKKFLIFAHHSDVLDGIEEIVRNKIEGNYIRIDGKSGSEQRNFLCKKFQHNDTVRVAILSITAANAGLNLSSASMVIFAELFWNPGILVQAEDRAHRIGQQDMVCVQYLVATGTSDDHIWPMIQRKLDVLGKAGLTKDNFSSAETTRLKDSRQEEIMKFLEESLLEDTFSDEMIEDSSPTKSAVKQQSILKYTSPLTKCKTSSQERISPIKKSTKQKQLFQYFSPKKEKEAKSVNDGKNMSTITENVSEQSHGHCLTSEGQGQINVGQVYDKDELDIMFEDFDDFSDDSMDDIDVDNLKPCVKKRKV